MSEANTIFVRIKPHNPKKGHRLRRFLVFGLKFEEEKGWYKINRTVTHGGSKVDVAGYLAEVRNSEMDEDSALAFDLVDTQAEALAIDAKEKKAAEKRASAAEPNAAQAIDLTSSDVQAGETKIISSVAKRRARSVRAPKEGET